MGSAHSDRELDTGSGAPLSVFPRFITFALQNEEVRPRMNMLEM
jgi:hypothetical protein